MLYILYNDKENALKRTFIKKVGYTSSLHHQQLNETRTTRSDSVSMFVFKYNKLQTMALMGLWWHICGAPGGRSETVPL